MRRRLTTAAVATALLAAACTGAPDRDPGSATGAAPTTAATEGSTVATAELVVTTTTAAATTTSLPEDPTERWRVLLAESGTELPGGGTEVFPDRRLVAYYGNPLTFRLGILGEYRPDGALRALDALIAEYEAAPVPTPTTVPPATTVPPTTELPGTAEPPTTAGAETSTTAEDTTTTTGPAFVENPPPIVPAFEIIATVATAAAGDDGDYSRELSAEDLRPWIDAATEAGAFVILDLQPGRTDFLTQARRYEEFLRQPNVGLALDPEWRLEPDEVHLRQIGSVDAAEVNTVVDYLVELVHDEVLPQKILVLHQFQQTMLPDRHLIRTPPELAVVVHVDGQGPLGSKYGTWDSMRSQEIGPDQTLWWGWKNFLDEDTPTATPGQTNAVQPLPVVVTYQ